MLKILITSGTITWLEIDFKEYLWRTRIFKSKIFKARHPQSLSPSNFLGYTINRGRFARLNFSRVLQKFSCEYKHLSLIILTNKLFLARQRESVSAKFHWGWNWMFSPVNLTTSMVWYIRSHNSASRNVNVDAFYLPKIIYSLFSIDGYIHHWPLKKLKFPFR